MSDEALSPETTGAADAVPEDAGSGRACPSCGRFIGGAKECHYCGARADGRLKEKTLLIVAVSLLLITAALCQLAYVSQDPEVRKIASFTEDDAFTHVRVVGKVVDDPVFYPDKYDPTKGTIRIRVNDTTGEMNIKLERPVTESILKSDRIPNIGDVVDARGTLYAGGDWLQLTVITPEFLTVRSRAYTPLTIPELSSAGPEQMEEFTLVEVEGAVSDVRVYSFATIFNLEDATSATSQSVAVYIPESVIALTGDEHSMDDIFQGAFVSVRGALVWYVPSGSVHGYWEIVPTSMDSLVVMEEAPFVQYPLYTLEDLLFHPEDNDGLLVRVENVTVYQVDESYLFHITQPGADVNLTVYVEGMANVTGTVETDSTVAIQGVFQKYYDVWELKVRSSRSDFVEVMP